MHNVNFFRLRLGFRGACRGGSFPGSDHRQFQNTCAGFCSPDEEFHNKGKIQIMNEKLKPKCVLALEG